MIQMTVPVLMSTLEDSCPTASLAEIRSETISVDPIEKLQPFCTKCKDGECVCNSSNILQRISTIFVARKDLSSGLGQPRKKTSPIRITTVISITNWEYALAVMHACMMRTKCVVTRRHFHVLNLAVMSTAYSFGDIETCQPLRYISTSWAQVTWQ